MNKTFGLIYAIFIMAACNNKATTVEEQTLDSIDNVVSLTAAQYKNAGITTGGISEHSITPLLKATGKIDVPPQNIVSISVPLGGYVKSTKLLPGMPIKKGEVLAVMEDPQYIQLQQDYLTAKARYVYSESEYKRQRELNEEKASSDKQHELAKAEYSTQQVLVKSLEQKLLLIGLNPASISPANISKSIRVISPINGYVSAVNVNIGKYVNPSDVLFELINPTDIHLSLTVFEKDVAGLSIGQKLVAYSNSNPEKKYNCSILLVSKNLADNNSMEVHCHFDNYDASLLPGMFMNAEIELAPQQTPALPEAAVVHHEGKHYVFVARGNNSFEMTLVETGETKNGFTRIQLPQELNNQTFATSGAYQLLMALKNKSGE